MILREYPQRSSLQKFFIFEADEDGNEPTTTVVSPNDEDGTDYTSDENNDNTTEVTADTEEGTDYTSEEEPETDGEQGDDVPDIVPPDDTGEDDEGADYTANADDTQQDGGAQYQEPEASDDELVERQKRYNMYQELMYLYNSNKAFISKLENIIRDDIESNAVINTVVGKLRDIDDIMFEFMTVRFMSTNYVEILTFYHSILSAIRLNFQMIKNNKEYLKQ